MKVLGDKYGVSQSAIALNWVICQGAIPLGGARNTKQAQEVSPPFAFNERYKRDKADEG